MRRSNIERLLPLSIRTELIERLKESGFSGYDAHSEWLKSAGHNFSKSAVHRFGQKIEAGMIPPERLTSIQLRLRCLELAAQENPPASDLKQRAEELLKWLG